MMIHQLETEHSHEHKHSHDDGNLLHVHAPVEKMKQAFFLTLVIFVVELIGGIVSHSLALLSDSGHVLTDIAAIGLSWYALALSQRPANAKMTFGYHRAGILAALMNGVSLIVVTLLILWGAYGRFLHTTPVSSTWMFISAGIGLALNLYLGLGMKSDDNMNVKSAVLHMLGDAAASAAVIVAGVVIAITHWYVIDPLLSVLIALFIAFSAWRIVAQTVDILMEATPHGITLQKVVDAVCSSPSVLDLHDVHIWSITSGRNALSCHVVMDGQLTLEGTQSVLKELEEQLLAIGIGHVTIQMEDESRIHHDTVLCCQAGEVGSRL